MIRVDVLEPDRFSRRFPLPAAIAVRASSSWGFGALRNSFSCVVPWYPVGPMRANLLMPSI